ncbi:MAG: CbiX/SirB N-terminal domain-containing protein [Candidatus Caldarchaeum sp.]
MSLATGCRIGVIVVGHGQMPYDLTPEIKYRYMRLKFKAERTEDEEKTFKQLEDTILNWPRNALNDPYASSLHNIAEELKRIGVFNAVWVAFNEFCKPTLREAIENACQSDVDVIVVVTTMTTRGGDHAEREIPAIMEAAKQKCSKTLIYAWPFDVTEVAQLLAKTVNYHLHKKFLTPDNIQNT